MFQGWSKGFGIDVSELELNRVLNMEGMFKDSTLALVTINATNLGSSGSKINFSYMFSGCSLLQEIYVSGVTDWRNLASSSTNMFAGCEYLYYGGATDVSRACLLDYDGFFTAA